jgi:tetratricopeptide (TPR) repeat protein
MMLHDVRGLPVATPEPVALATYQRAAEQLLAYEGNPLATIQEALDRDPGFVAGHCLAAAFAASTTEKALLPVIRAAVEAGEAHPDRAGPRERAHLAGARAWLEGDLDRAVDLYGRVAIEWPRDTVALQLAHLGDFSLGQAAMLRDRIGQALRAWDEDVPGYGFVLGMHAFGLEESGDFRRAEETGRRGVELEPRDAWSAHAVAHVMEMEARLPEGIAWLEETGQAWAPDNGFAFHNHWHHALYRLDLGDAAGALDLYDRRIRPARSDVCLELIDAAALLWRLFLLGVDVGDRFRQLADDWRPRIEDRVLVFNDVHAMMAFAAAGREDDVRALLAAIEARAASRDTNARMIREVGLPVARALAAFGRGDHAACLETLLPVRPTAIRFGGSNAQRDVLSLTLVEAALRSGRRALAEALASERTRLRPGNPAGWLIAARAHRIAGDAARAEGARRQAERLREVA